MSRIPQHATRALAILGLFAASGGAALAQDNAAAGLFVGEARQLPLVSQSLTVEVHGDEARVHLTQDFLNDGSDEGQADYQLFLPEGATVEGFGFWNDDRLFEAKLQEKSEAEARHSQAASSGRTTGLLTAEDQLHSFSVYPVPGGAIKRVETTLRMPVEMDLGRSQLRLPIDAFLGQEGPDSTVMVDLHTLEPLRGADLDAGDFITLASGERHARLAWTTDAPSTLSWWEEAPPLLVKAERVPLEGDDVGLQLRIVLSDASEAGFSVPGLEGPVHLVVDGSFSMQRRAREVDLVVEHLESRLDGELEVHTVDRHSLSWSDLSEVMDDLGCGASGDRCVVLSDAQLSGLPDSRQANTELLLLADTHEKAWMPDRVAASAVFQPGVEPDARLRSLADELVLPVLEIEGLLLGEQSPELLGKPRLRVAEGGSMKVYGVPEGAMGDTLRVLASIGGEAVDIEVPVASLDRESDLGRTARRGWYRAQLRDLMSEYRDAPSESLKQRVVDLSLREGIPTAFTALQVDDPELSLVAIKPGDPVLTVHGEMGLAEVAAWYPFGDARRLVREDAADSDLSDFSDRFLVPRSWEERAYRVEVFKGFADGTQTREQVWYYLDEQAPQVSLKLADGQLVVDAGEDAIEVSSVRLQVEGREQALEQDEADGAWKVEESALAGTFAVLIRDRAGNRSVVEGQVIDGELALEAGRRDVGAERLAWSERPVSMGGADGAVSLSVEGGRLGVQRGENTSWSTEPLALRSLVLSSHLELAEGGVLVGTRGGELVHVDPSGRVSLVPMEHPEHPVTGLASMADGTVLVGVLGVGLLEWDGSTVVPSRHKVGSAFITGVDTTSDGTVLVATAYNGLWRVRRGRAHKTRFASDHVTGLERVGDTLRIRSGLRSYERHSTDRFALVETAGNGLRTSAPDLTAAVVWQGRTVVAGFDTGLWTLGEDGQLDSLPMDLDVHGRRVNDLVVHQGLLWLATEGGTHVVEPGSLRVTEVHASASYDLDAVADGVAVASSGGLLVYPEAVAEPFRLDTDAEGEILAGTGKWMSVAWHEGGLMAGGMEGLVRFASEPAPVTVAEGFRANWVTSLLSTDEGLVVGTYADGVWLAESDGTELSVAPMAGLETAWVPPHALAAVNGELYVGGIGEAPRVRSSDGRVEALRVPARDINGFLGQADGTVLVVTSDGLARVGETPLAARGSGSTSTLAP